MRGPLQQIWIDFGRKCIYWTLILIVLIFYLTFVVDNQFNWMLVILLIACGGILQAEASMNAQALKKFVEENQKLAAMCADSLAECKRWEGECSLYDKDREALMDFGNEAHERAKEAEARAQHMEEEVQRLSDELLCYKDKLGSHGVNIFLYFTPLKNIFFF